MELEVKNQPSTVSEQIPSSPNRQKCLEFYCDIIQARKQSLEDQQNDNQHVHSSTLTATSEGGPGKDSGVPSVSLLMSQTKADSSKADSPTQPGTMRSPDSKTDPEHKQNFLSGLQTTEMSVAASVTKERPLRACKKGKDPRLKLCENPDCTQKGVVRKRFCSKTSLYCQVGSLTDPAMCQHDRQGPVLSYLSPSSQSLGGTLDHMQRMRHHQPCEV